MTRSPLILFWVLLLSAACTSKPVKQGFSFSSLSARETGIDFSNTITESDSVNLLMNEYAYMGSGIGIGDFNKDGLPDVFFAASQESSRLYLNKGSMRFEDITATSGIGTREWCTGVSIVDINQDGWQDIYVCVSGTVEAVRRKNLLFINQGNLSFKEEAAAYNLDDTSYSTQAAFFDYDKDGDLDMYLLNHRLQVEMLNTIRTRVMDGSSALADKLYRNDGIQPGSSHPVFNNTTAAAGIVDDGHGLGIAISDINADGYPDIYVANDYISNDELWLNRGDGSFINAIATAMRHQSYSSMGTDIADFNNDGLPDIVTLDMQPETNERKKMMYSFLTDVRYKLEREAGYEPSFMRNMLHLNNGMRSVAGRTEPFFSEIGQLAGVSETDWSWSVLMADFDNDGWKDIHITNGMGRDLINADFVQYRAATSYQPGISDGQKEKRGLVERLASFGSVPLTNYFYRNKGNLFFEDISAKVGITEKNMANGAVFADMDNDGDLDILTNNINSPATVLRNELNGTDSSHYISLLLIGDSMNKEAIGTKITAYRGKQRQYFEQNPVRGYLSSVDQRIHIGFNKERPDSIVIVWPDEARQTIISPAVDTILTVKKAGILTTKVETVTEQSFLFTDISTTLNLSYRHKESFFYDYGFQSLLPQKYSQEGPFISTGDLNGDGREDFFAGAAYSFQGKVFIQNPGGGFTGKDILTGEKEEEDMQSILLDADADKDLDLFVVSGSSEHELNSPYYKPRLYLNDGKANFSISTAAVPPGVSSPAKCVAGADFDGDGDTDVFIGGRVIVGNYPQPPRSFLLRNDKGKFTDITPPALQYPGLLNAAVWADIDNDKQAELVLAGEWMPLRIYKYSGGSWADITESVGTGKHSGFWRAVTAADIDGDGDIDLLAGNLGLNNPYHVSGSQPARLIARDFDNNGVVEPIFCYYIKDNQGLYRESIGITRDQWAAQMPSVKKRYDQNQPYAAASISQILTPEQMNGATVLSCNEIRSGYFENNGKGSFAFHPFVTEAQFAPVNVMLATDIDMDGKTDILLAGNEYEYNVAIGRMDASYGLLLKGDGKGSFAALPAVQTGWISDGDIRDMKWINADGHRLLLLTKNDDALQILKLKK